MSKLEAVRTIIFEAESRRRSKTALKRIRRACKALDLSDEETAEVERLLDYRGFDDKVYAVFA